MVLSAPLWAVDDGGQPLAFTKNGLGARPMGFGGAFTAVADDLYAAYYNPAGFTQIKDVQLGSQLALLSGGRNFNLLAAAQPTAGKSMAYGVSWVRMDLAEGIEKRVKNTPEPLALLSDTQDAFFLTLAGDMPLAGAHWGFNAKYISHRLGEAEGNGFGLDLGFLFRVNGHLRLGLTAEDLYTRLDWSTGHSEEAAMRTRLGAAWEAFGRRLLLSAEAEINAQQAIKARAGVEWWALGRIAALRAGYNAGRFTGGLGFCLPLGRRWEGRLDYALATDPAVPEQMGHRVSATFVFSSAPPKEMDIEKSPQPRTEALP